MGGELSVRISRGVFWGSRKSIPVVLIRGALNQSTLLLTSSCFVDVSKIQTSRHRVGNFVDISLRLAQCDSEPTRDDFKITR